MACERGTPPARVGSGSAPGPRATVSGGCHRRRYRLHRRGREHGRPEEGRVERPGRLSVAERSPLGTADGSTGPWSDTDELVREYLWVRVNYGWRTDRQFRGSEDPPEEFVPAQRTRKKRSGLSAGDR